VLNPLTDSSSPVAAAVVLPAETHLGGAVTSPRAGGQAAVQQGPGTAAAGSKAHSHSSTDRTAAPCLPKRPAAGAVAAPHLQQQQQMLSTQPPQSPRSAALDSVRAAVATLSASRAAAAAAAAANKRPALSVTPLTDAIAAGPALHPVLGSGAAAGAAALRDSIDVAAEAANQWSGASSPASMYGLPLPPFTLGDGSN
jgi:hypothetical protein